jgi:hypothetical protein
MSSWEYRLKAGKQIAVKARCSNGEAMLTGKSTLAIGHFGALSRARTSSGLRVAALIINRNAVLMHSRNIPLLIWRGCWTRATS